MKDTSIVFFGTPEFAVRTLQSLSETCTVLAVVTQPDRPSGRGKKLLPPPVKTEALKLGLSVFQPAKIRDSAFVEWLESLSPDFLVTAAYGKILPLQLLEVPKLSALNVHASLLPRWRGAAPIHRAVMAGDDESGITIMHMDVGMDTGDIILQQATPIGPDDTTGDLHDKLAVIGASLVVDAVTAIVSGNASRTKQNESLATLAPPLTREEEIIDWSASAEAIHNLVRGMNPWPGAYTWVNGNRLKIWAGQPFTGKKMVCGEIISAGKEGLLVAAGDGAYRITTLQPTGKKVMAAGDFLRGNPIVPGTVLGK